MVHGSTLADSTPITDMILTEDQIADIEAKWNVDVLDARGSYDASEATGQDTYCVACRDRNEVIEDYRKPLTLYVTFANDQAQLAWDVSGYPSWYAV